MRQSVIQWVSTTQLRHDGREISSKGRVHQVEETVLVRLGGEAVVNAVEFRVVALENSWVNQVKLLGFRVEGEPG